MTKKILSAVLAVMLVLSLASFAVSADDELAYYVEAGATGNGTEDSPFGTIDEAILALNGKDGTVYVYGAYDMTAFKAPAWEGMVTIAGASSDSILTAPKSAGIVFNGDVTFKDILTEIGEHAHFNPNGTKMICDFGEDANFAYMIHTPALGNAIVEEGYNEWNSGTLFTFYLGGSYSTSYANGVMGDNTLVVNGGKIKTVNLAADSYMDNMTGISVGGNMNLVVNGGEITQIATMEKTAPEIMGALNIIFNNGMEAPEKFAYPEETVAGGVYIVYSEEGGKIMPTADAGVFEVISDSETKVAKIDGKLVYNGTVELQPGENFVEWVAGQQPAKAEEKTEIKLTIGKAEITTNSTAKALDVPAQIVDSRTLVPVRAIAESFGCDVAWDDATKTVTITK